MLRASYQRPSAFKDKTTFTVTVPEGRTGAAVRDVQQVLEKLGYSVGPPGLDGIRGPYTTAAVKKFQEDNPPLEVDGDPGPETVAVMNKILKDKPKVAAALKSSTPDQVKAPTSGGSDKSNTGVAAAAGPLPPLAMNSVTAGKVGKILDLVSGPESRGLYDIMNGSVRAPEILNMTIADANKFQIKHQRTTRFSSAMGRYQIMAENTIPYAKMAGLDPNRDLFSPENQDKMGIVFLREKGLEKWLDGTISNEKFMKGLARVWAGLPSPENNGKSFYDKTGNKVGNNVAGMSLDAVDAALNDIRQS